VYAAGMASCACCHLPASATIPATNGRVCVAHAIEFWNAFLAFAKESRPEADAVTPSARVRASRTRKLDPAAKTEKANGRP
jgi:hypothetical protein